MENINYEQFKALAKEEQQNILTEMRQTMTVGQVSEVLGVNKNTLTTYMRNKGLTTSVDNEITTTIKQQTETHTNNLDVSMTLIVTKDNATSRLQPILDLMNVSEGQYKIEISLKNID